MCAWQLTDSGDPVGAYPCPGDPSTLTPTQRADLIQALRAHQDHWLITGPCLDGGWYAIPRHDQTQPRLSAPTLPDLTLTLNQHSSATSRTSPAPPTNSPTPPNDHPSQ